MSKIRVKKYKYLILATIVILSFCFYWIFMRPVIGKKNCNKEAIKSAINQSQGHGYVPIREIADWNIVEINRGDESRYRRGEYEKYYKDCLRSKGL